MAENDAGDLQWLDARAEETARYLNELMAKSNERADAGDTVGFVEAMREVMSAMDTAVAAKAARDDAYTAQEILHPPPPPRVRFARGQGRVDLDDAGRVSRCRV